MELRPVNPGDRCGNACSLKAFYTTARGYKAFISAPKHMLCGSSMSKGRKPSSLLLSAEMGNPFTKPILLHKEGSNLNETQQSWGWGLGIDQGRRIAARFLQDKACEETQWFMELCYQA